MDDGFCNIFEVIRRCGHNQGLESADNAEGDVKEGIIGEKASFPLRSLRNALLTLPAAPRHFWRLSEAQKSGMRVSTSRGSRLIGVRCSLLTSAKPFGCCGAGAGVQLPLDHLWRCHIVVPAGSLGCWGAVAVHSFPVTELLGSCRPWEFGLQQTRHTFFVLFQQVPER